MDDDELHIWSNITSQEFLSKVNVRPATLTTTIPNVIPTIFNVPVEFDPGVHEDVVAERNVDAIGEDGNWMDVYEVQPPVSHNHPSPNDALSLMLPIPSQHLMRLHCPFPVHTTMAHPTLWHIQVHC